MTSKVRKREDYFFFFRRESPLSQWNSSHFVIDGVLYNCCEQYMMAEKARLFDDHETLELIMNTDSPREQKRLGRLVKPFDQKRWDAEARRVIFDGNMAKFSQNIGHRKYLLNL